MSAPEIDAMPTAEPVTRRAVEPRRPNWTVRIIVTIVSIPVLLIVLFVGASVAYQFVPEHELGNTLGAVRSAPHVVDADGMIPYPKDPSTSQVEVLMDATSSGADVAEVLHRIDASRQGAAQVDGDLYLDVSFTDDTTLGTLSTDWTAAELDHALDRLRMRAAATEGARLKMLALSPTTDADESRICPVFQSAALGTRSARDAAVAGRAGDYC